MLETYRPLIRLWVVILALAGVGMATLQILGPPAARGLRQGEPQAAAPPQPPVRADQPAAAVSLPPAAAEPPALAASAPAAPVQPSRRKAHAWARRGAWPARAPANQDSGDDHLLAEHGQAAPLPLERGASPPPVALSPPPRAPAYQHVAGYVGIFTTGADGARVFKATP